jgi:hypothetical protein
MAELAVIIRTLSHLLHRCCRVKIVDDAIAPIFSVFIPNKGSECG